MDSWLERIRAWAPLLVIALALSAPLVFMAMRDNGVPPVSIHDGAVIVADSMYPLRVPVAAILPNSHPPHFVSRPGFAARRLSGGRSPGRMVRSGGLT